MEEMTNDIFRDRLTYRDNLAAKLSEIEAKYKEKMHPNDFMAQMIDDFEIEDIENDEELGKDYKFFEDLYSRALKEIAAYVRAHRWQVSIWDEQKPFGEQKTIIGNYADKDTAWEIAKSICGTVAYDDSVPEI